MGALFSTTKEDTRSSSLKEPTRLEVARYIWSYYRRAIVKKVHPSLCTRGDRPPVSDDGHPCPPGGCSAYIEHLPTDLGCRILSHLDIYQWVRCSLVSKSFSRQTNAMFMKETLNVCPLISQQGLPETENWNRMFVEVFKKIALFNVNFPDKPQMALGYLLKEFLGEVSFEGAVKSGAALELLWGFGGWTLLREGRLHCVCLLGEAALGEFMGRFEMAEDLGEALREVSAKVLPWAKEEYVAFWKAFMGCYIKKNRLEDPKIEKIREEATMGNKLKAAQMFRLLPECDYNLEIMRLLPEYLSTFDFTGIDLLHALQLFIASVKLPGEASLIDRLMTHWAERYTKFFVEIQENWEVCLDGGRYEHKVQRVTDDIFIMAFALVMLETDLKSPLITNKMTWENWRVGILPVEWDVDYLKELYDQVSRL